MTNADARPASVHFQAVDGLRGLAIALVLLFHFWQQTWLNMQLPLPGFDWRINLNVLAETGFIGVQLFFVLSGFCIAWPYTADRPLRPGEFLSRRAAKILPSYWLFLFVCVVWVLPAHLGESWPRHLFFNLLFLQSWAPEYLYHSFNPVLWSLAIEIHFYLLFAWLGRSWLRYSGRILLYTLAVWAGFGLWALAQPAEHFDLYRHQLWPHLPYFAVGVWLARWQRRSGALPLPWLAGGIGMLIWIGVAWWLYRERHAPALIPGTLWPTGREYLAVPLFAAGFGLSLAGVLRSTFWRRLFSLPWLAGLGLISYNLYLWHQFLIVKLRHWDIPPLGDLPLGQGPGWQIAIWTTALTLAIGGSWLLTRYFEEPLRQRWNDHRLSLSRIHEGLRALAAWWLRGVAALGQAPRAPWQGWRHALWLHRWPLLTLLLSWGLLNLWLQLNALQLREDGLWAGHLNIWSDWPIHAAMATAFADRPVALWLGDHPMFAGEPLIYPFAVNLLSGLLLRLGLGIDAAMTLPTLAAAIATPCLIYALAVLLLGRRLPALLVVGLFYLGAGNGGWHFLWDVASRGDWAALAYPPLEVSRLDRYDWYSGNALTGMLLPQRAFVAGFPLALFSLVALLVALTRARERPLRWAVAGGLAAGLLPVVHTHSFLALALTGGVTAALHPRAWRIWGLYAALAGLLGGSIAALFLSAAEGLPNHLRWAPGFAAPAGVWSWILMWWQLWGLSIPLSAAALLVRDLRLRGVWLAAAAGLACFVFANLALIQPNRWDNSKIFLWTWLFWTIPQAALLDWLWQQRRGLRPVAGGLALAVCMTGIVEIWRLARVDHGSYMMASRTEYQLAQRIRHDSPPDARFLTATAHNHPVMAWGGRPIYLGFTGWIANLGFDYRERESTLRQLFRGGAGTLKGLRENRIDYVYIGAAERQSLDAAQDWFDAHLPLAFEAPGARVYRVPRAGAAP